MKKELAMGMLAEVKPEVAIGHSLWEAHACIGVWALCACLAMLRKVVDLWSAEYRDKHGMKFNKSAGEKDNVYWRLQKIASENRLYSESIHSIIDALRLDANDALHDKTTCFGGTIGRFDGSQLADIRNPFQLLHQTTVYLIRSTMPNVKVMYSDSSRWSKDPPSN